MYSMKQACALVDLPYETLKFYCNQGLVPNVKRDENNYRVFDDKDIKWITGLMCVKRCGMGIKDMKTYTEYCQRGESTIALRKEMLAKLKNALLQQIDELDDSIHYIDNKQHYYDDVLSGAIIYHSNLTD